MSKADNKNLIEGTVQGNVRGYGFLLPTDKTLNDCFIPNYLMHGAQHGDRVLAEKTNVKSGERTEVAVVKVIERGVTELIGEFSPYKGGGFVIPDDSRYFCDIFVENGKTKNAKKGDKVSVKITSYPIKKKNPEGIITEILGKSGDRLTETACILKANGIAEKFKKPVLDEADRVAKPVSEKDKNSREDFTDDTVITIDGESAKDFDDAINVTRLDGGNYRLSVHIADVTHYVKFGSMLDKSALERGTSTYFPEKVVPMLPKSLSDDVCSLKEGVERLTLSVIMEINGEGETVDKRIVKGVIKSKARMTYNKVYGILNGDENLIKIYGFLLPMLSDAYCLYKILADKRSRRGSVNLDVKESEITVVGGEIEVKPFDRNFAHGMIEEFMIAANECVAEYMYYLETPFIYRVHDKPTPEKTAILKNFLNELGVKTKWKEESVRPSDYSSVMKKFEGTGLFPFVNRIILRSMQKAKYQTEDIGHFGLASEHYCHFTSPIRRYPDLAIHRIIKDMIDGGGDLLWDKYGEFVKNAAEQSSLKERSSELAERQADDLYKALYMQERIGERFFGIVSGVTDFGVFVELENTVEGLIRLEGLPRGNYKFDDKNMRLYSGKYEFRLGRKVEILVAGVDMTLKKIEFLLVDGLECLKKGKKGEVNG